MIVAVYCTGMLTFDGNVRVKKKVTYCKIKEHLEEKYSRKFSMEQWQNYVLHVTNVANPYNDTRV